jgi:hypothetical protein
MGTVDALQAHKAPSRRDFFMMTPPIIVGCSGLNVVVAGRLCGHYAGLVWASLMWVK